MTGISTGLRAGSRSGKQLSRLPGLATRLCIAFGICCLLLAARAVPQALRLDQTPEVRQLEQPTSAFLSQIGMRGHVQVLQTTPLHLLVNVNCSEPSRQALERQLHNLYDIQESRGDQLIVINGHPPVHWREFPHLALGLWGLGNGFLALALYRLAKQGIEILHCRPRNKNPWVSRILRLSPLLTAAAVVWAAAPPLALVLHLLVLLWWRLRSRHKNLLLQRRTIVNGRQEAAILLMSFEPQVSAQFFKELGPEAVHSLTLEISKLPPISPEVRAAVIATFEGCLRQASPGARLDRLKPELMASVLETYYLNSPMSGQLAQPRPGRKYSWKWLHKTSRALAGALIGAVTVVPFAWSLLASPPPPLQLELQRLIAARPMAVVMVERDGRNRGLVALGTDNLNALRPLVAERALQLGLDPLEVGCLGVKRRYHFPFRLLGGVLLGLGALALWRRPRLEPVKKVTCSPPPPSVALPPPPPPAKPSPDSMAKTLAVDEVSLEVGRGLLCLVDPSQGAKLLERVTSIRRHIGLELGYVLPGVRFRDNLRLQHDEYLIRIRDVEVARGIVRPNRFLALLAEEKLDQLEGERVLDPTFGLPGVWISPEQLKRAEQLGATIFDAVSVTATQLTQVAREHAADIFTFNAALELLKQPQLAAVLEQLERRGQDNVALWKILRDLLRQQVCIRDLTGILQGLLELVDCTTPHELKVEIARLTVRDRIIRELCGGDTVKPAQDLVIWRVTPELLQHLDQGPVGQAELLGKLSLVGERMRNAGHVAAVLVAPELRSRLQSVTLGLKSLRVISTAEIPDWVNLRFFYGEGKL